MPRPTDASAPSERSTARELTRGSIWSLATLAISAGGGFAFWIVAPLTSPDAVGVGRASAWFSLLQLVIIASSIGAPILVSRRGADADAPRLAGAVAATVGVVAAFGGLVSPIFAGETWRTLPGIGGVALPLLMAVFAVGSAWTVIVDARLMSLRAWPWVFARGAIPALVRIPLLALDPLDDRGTWIVVVALAPIAASGVLAAVVLGRLGAIEAVSPARLALGDARFLATQHVGALATQAPFYVIPLMVAARVESEANAAFYLVFGIGVMSTMVPHTLSQVLLSEVSIDAEDRSRRVRRTLAANVGCGVVAWTGSVLVGPTLLAAIGDVYGEMAGYLPWLVVASTAFGVTAVGLTEARLAGDAALTNAITWAIAIGSIGTAAILVPWRPIDGAVAAWVLANLAAMSVAFVGVETRLRRGRPEPSADRVEVVEPSRVGAGLSSS